MDKSRLTPAIAAATMVMFSTPAFAQNKGSEGAQPSGDWMQRLESSIFDTPSTGQDGDGRQGSKDAYASTDAPSAPQLEDEQDFKNGRAELTGDSADDAPTPENDGADAPDKYVPDAGDPDN